MKATDVVNFSVRRGDVSCDMSILLRPSDGYDWAYYRERVFKQLDEYAAELVNDKSEAA